MKHKLISLLLIITLLPTLAACEDIEVSGSAQDTANQQSEIQ